VLRTGRSWPGNISSPNRSSISADGWFGGLHSSDPSTDGYILPTGATTQNFTVQCPATPPASSSDGFACEAVPKGDGTADRQQFACLFNIKDDPCEMVDQSASQPGQLRELWARLAGE
jgi:hypothetical protein